MRKLVFIFLFLAACANPYSTPEVHPDKSFRGVQSYLSEGNDHVRLILTHGMCSDSHRAKGDPKKKNWVARRASQIARALSAEGDATISIEYKKSYPTSRSDPNDQAVQRYEAIIETGNETIEAVFLIWGRHVDPYRANLEYENGEQSEDDPEKPIRANLNRAMKTELMNRCLIDAVVYLGPNGDPIRRDMRNALCDVMGGQFTQARRPGAIDLKATCRRPAVQGRPTILIPESLGSTILFDAYLGLDDKVGGNALAQSLSEIGSIFLASNQLPLLRQGMRPDGGAVTALRATETRRDSLTGFLDLLGRSSVRTLDGVDHPRPQLVAITDPNDILGYRLDDETIAGGGVDLRNVLVSNTSTYLGLFANPIEAHRNTERSQVFDIIMKGYRE